MSRRPLIGITPTPSTATFDHGSFYRFCLSDTYVRAVWQEGGNPVILPWVADTPEDILGEIDGLILSGGGDIDPARFDQERHAQTYGIDDARDRFEIALMRAAAGRDVPTLAICRGIQVMTVAFGGTIEQHVPDRDGSVQHRQHEDGIGQHAPSHAVTIETATNPIRTLLGVDRLMVNSFHHQAPAEVPEPLRVAAWAEDGVIEAIWHPGMTFGIGVQWHPEMLAAGYPQHAALFRALVESTKTPASV